MDAAFSQFTTIHPDSEAQILIPSVDEEQMREVDRIAVEDFGLGLLQMMENAGRNLAALAMESLPDSLSGRVLVAAGSGGNGGGGLCAARHLINRGVAVKIVLTRPEEDLQGAPAAQLAVLRQAGVQVTPLAEAESAISSADLVLDALIGYSLRGAPTGTSRMLIEMINAAGRPVISLDLPSGIEATSGKTPGKYIRAAKTLTLALPKPGLIHPDAGELYLADIGIPNQVYKQLGIHFEPFWGYEYSLRICRVGTVR
jgi:NAD(P)H-hydrate epimerase